MTNNWNRNYLLAKQYYEENGNLLIPQSYEVNGIKLGIWIMTQRQNYKKGKLTTNQIEDLNKIGMVWEVEKSFNDYYELAKSYYEKNGNLLIPISYEINGIKLGIWIINQRQNYKNGKLTDEKIKALNTIGMVWKTKNRLNFDDYYELTKSHYEKNGNLLIPMSYEVSGIKLGNWITNQRQNYKNGKLTDEKIKALNTIGMVWKTKNRLNFDDYYELTKSHYEKNGNLLIPMSYEVSGIKLGNWITNQRQNYKNGKLTDEKIKALNTIGMVWKTKNRLNFDDYYELAKSYYEKNGNLLIPISYEVNGIKLGKWIDNRRQDYKNNKLSVEHVKKLNAIDMIWNKKQITIINKIKKNIDNNNQEPLLNAINQMSFCCLEDSLTGILSYLNDNISLYDLKQKSKMINSIMQNILPSMNYQILSLYTCGFTLNEISQIYKISITEVEKIRLNSYKFILKSLKTEPLEPEKTYSKKLNISR